MVYSPSNFEPGDFGVMQSSHQAALETKHHALDERIARENQRPAPDAIMIADLKKQKLRLKQEITRL